MTAPAYGYHHRGVIQEPGPLADYWTVRVGSINPQRALGPLPSAVPNLAPGDRVLLSQVGTTRDDLVITGKLPPVGPESILPIGIDDVTGLQAALDNRATDTELATLASNVDALASGIDGRLDGHDTDIATLQSADTALDGRLDTAEGTISSHTGTLATNTANIATNAANITTEHNTNVTQDARLTSLETWSRAFEVAEFDTFGDLFSSMPRILATNQRTIVNNTGYYWITRSRVAATSTRVRLTVVTAGTVGNCTGMLLKSSTLTGVYTPIGTATNNLQAVGVRDFVFTGANISPGDYLMAFFVGGGYSVAPAIVGQQNAVRYVPSVSPIWGTKAGLVAPPATISPTDGTWTTDSAPWWIAVG